MSHCFVRKGFAKVNVVGLVTGEAFLVDYILASGNDVLGMKAVPLCPKRPCSRLGSLLISPVIRFYRGKIEIRAFVT